MCSLKLNIHPLLSGGRRKAGLLHPAAKHSLPCLESISTSLLIPPTQPLPLQQPDMMSPLLSLALTWVACAHPDTCCCLHFNFLEEAAPELIRSLSSCVGTGEPHVNVGVTERSEARTICLPSIARTSSQLPSF